MNALDAAHEKGRAAAKAGLGPESCPYQDKRKDDGRLTFSRAFRNAWFAGWKKEASSTQPESAQRAEEHMEFSDFKTTVSNDNPGHGYIFDSNDGMLPFSARSHRMDVFLRKNTNPFSSGIYWTVIVRGHGLPQVEAEGRYLNEARATVALKLLDAVMDS